MKSVLLLGLCVFALAISVPAQNDSFQIGTKTINIPPPQDFTEATSRIEGISRRFIAYQMPSRELLGIYVPADVLPRLAKNREMDLELFARVSISKKGKDTDFTQKMFAAVVADLEKNINTYLDPKGPVMKKAEKKIELGRAQLTGKEADVRIDETTNLGFFEKTDDVFSAMMLTNNVLNGRRVHVLATLSCVRVNDRLLVLNVARAMPEKEDFEKLPEFTKKWTAAIVEANN